MLNMLLALQVGRKTGFALPSRFIKREKLRANSAHEFGVWLHKNKGSFPVVEINYNGDDLSTLRDDHEACSILADALRKSDAGVVLAKITFENKVYERYVLKSWISNDFKLRFVKVIDLDIENLAKHGFAWDVEVCYGHESIVTYKVNEHRQLVKMDTYLEGEGRVVND